MLYVDTENPNTTILHQVKIANLDVDFVGMRRPLLDLACREGGMNLRDRRTRADMENVLQKTRPEIVFAGPLYKLTHRKSGEDMEQATLELLEILDDFRVRFNFALMIEHHAPKGSGISGHREMNPFGSSVLLRWPEFGITLEQEGHTSPNEDLMTLNVGRFRDREQADWPDTITRGKMGQRAVDRPLAVGAQQVQLALLSQPSNTDRTAGDSSTAPNCISRPATRSALEVRSDFQLPSFLPLAHALAARTVMFG